MRDGEPTPTPTKPIATVNGEPVTIETNSVTVDVELDKEFGKVIVNFGEMVVLKKVTVGNKSIEDLEKNIISELEGFGVKLTNVDGVITVNIDGNITEAHIKKYGKAIIVTLDKVTFTINLNVK